MKKLAVLFFLFFIQFSFSNNIDEKVINILNTEKSFFESNFDRVACCDRRTSTGKYGEAGYVQVKVTRCATSNVSQQDAFAKACVLAEASADRALEVAIETNESVTIGG